MENPMNDKQLYEEAQEALGKNWYLDEGNKVFYTLTSFVILTPTGDGCWEASAWGVKPQRAATPEKALEALKNTSENDAALSSYAARAASAAIYALDGGAK